MSRHTLFTQSARRKVIPLLAGIFLSMGLQSSLHAQFIEDTVFYYQDRFLLPATDAEEEKLDAAQDKHEAEIKSLQDQLEKIELELRRLKQDQVDSVDKLLSPARWRSIQKQLREETQARVEKNQVFLDEFIKFSTQIAKAEKLTIYEGLHRAGPEEIKAIKAKEKTVQFDGFDFYAQPLQGKPGTQEELRDLLTDHQRFMPHVGKFCGGFHPDIALQYEVAGQQYLAFICLGCWELKVIGPGQEYMFDFDESNHKAFVQIANSIFTHRKLDKRGL